MHQQHQRFGNLTHSFPKTHQYFKQGWCLFFLFFWLRLVLPVSIVKKEWGCGAQLIINIHTWVTSQGVCVSRQNDKGWGILSEVLDAKCWWRDNQPQSVPAKRQTAVKSLTSWCLQRKREQQCVLERAREIEADKKEKQWKRRWEEDWDRSGRRKY